MALEPVDVQQRGYAEMGAAFARVERALPQSWVFWAIQPGTFSSALAADGGVDRTLRTYEALALGRFPESKKERCVGQGATLTAALTALAEALEARKAAE